MDRCERVLSVVSSISRALHVMSTTVSEVEYVKYFLAGTCTTPVLNVIVKGLLAYTVPLYSPNSHVARAKCEKARKEQRTRRV